MALAAVPVWAADDVSSDRAVKAAREAIQGVPDEDTIEADGMGHGTVAVAPTSAEAEQAYEDARKAFMEVSGTAGPQRTGDMDMPVSLTDVVKGGARPENVKLENIRVVMDVENVTLRDVVTRIVQHAAKFTGPWTVKWRLKPENSALLDERVNLTAEAPFGEFCNLLTERVKNMTGTQLYITAFHASRIILVTDTYY